MRRDGSGSGRREASSSRSRRKGVLTIWGAGSALGYAPGPRRDRDGALGHGRRRGTGSSASAPRRASEDGVSAGAGGLELGGHRGLRGDRRARGVVRAARPRRRRGRPDGRDDDDPDTRPPPTPGPPTNASAPAVAVTPRRTDSTVSPTSRTVYAPADGGRSLFTTSGEAYRAVTWSGGGSRPRWDGRRRALDPARARGAVRDAAGPPRRRRGPPRRPDAELLHGGHRRQPRRRPGRRPDPPRRRPGPTPSRSISPPGRRASSRTSSRRSATSGAPRSRRARRSPGRWRPRSGTARGACRPVSSPASPTRSTTGLGFTSLDASREVRVFRKALNGLKNTAGFPDERGGREPLRPRGGLRDARHLGRLLRRHHRRAGR